MLQHATLMRALSGLPPRPRSPRHAACDRQTVSAAKDVHSLMQRHAIAGHAHHVWADVLVKGVVLPAWHKALRAPCLRRLPRVVHCLQLRTRLINLAN